MIGIHVDCGGIIVMRGDKLICDRCQTVLHVDGRCVIDNRTGEVTHGTNCSCKIKESR